MKYKTKLTFHIPCASWDDGLKALIEINCAAFIQILLKSLADIGLTSLYSVPAKGYYKGREYDEILLTVFCRKQSAGAAIEVFQKTFRAYNNIMRQEAFAYEHNGILFTESLSQEVRAWQRMTTSLSPTEY